MTGPFRIEVLGDQHEREKFSCGVEALDRYFLERMGQDVRRRATVCYVALENNTGRVASYYTLAAGGVPLTDMPEELIKRLPRYPSVPVAKLGRLAVDVNFQKRQLGGALLWDAVMRALRSEVAVFALVVNAKNDHAEAFYRHHGFKLSPSTTHPPADEPYFQKLTLSNRRARRDRYGRKASPALPGRLKDANKRTMLSTNNSFGVSHDTHHFGGDLRKRLGIKKESHGYGGGRRRLSCRHP